MPTSSSSKKTNFHHNRFTQISESHCGPAVIQMLLDNLGIEVTQEQVAEAGGAKDLIELNGMRVDQLAEAVKQLAPGTRFWYKSPASLEDLITTVRDYRFPSGVEWQGLFYTTPEEEPETDDDDYGHYSVVTMVDPENHQLVIADPYKDFREQDRVFGFEFFLPRWYDYNEVEDPATGKEKLVEDLQMMFIVTPKDEEFPEELGMKAA